jgi:hypothetical protein
MLALLAYLDPGTGSLIIQAIIGGMLAGGFFMRRFFGGIFRGIGRLFGVKNKTDKDAADTPE